LFDLEVKIPKDSSEKLSVTRDLPIEKGLCVKYPISQYIYTDNLSYRHQSFIVAIDAIKIPTSIQEAMRSEHWTQAMREEMDAIERNSTWEIVDKPRDKKTVRCKWIFKVKHKANVSIDYEETFSPVEMMNTVRVVLALA